MSLTPKTLPLHVMWRTGAIAICSQRDALYTLFLLLLALIS